MARDLEVEARLTLKDDLSKKAGTALDAVGKKARNAGKAADALTAPKKDAGARAYERTAQAADKAASAIDKVARSADRARDANGRFVSGSGSGLGRVAQDAARAERSMGRLEAMARRTGTALSKVGSGMGAARDAGASLMAGGYVMAQAVKKPIAREERLARLANIGYSEHDKEGRIAGMKELDALARETVKKGGGSDEQAIGLLESLMAGGMETEQIKRLAPDIQKAATSMGADNAELATLVVAGLKQGQFGEADVPDILEKMNRAGELGAFEGKDTTKWLPQLMASASGMQGAAGTSDMLAHLEAVRNVTGSSDQAGNAYDNYLAYIKSPEAAKNLEEYGVTLTKELIAYNDKGISTPEAFADILEKRVVNTNRTVQNLQKRITQAKTPEERQKLEQQLDIAKKAAISTVVRDRQAGLGAAGMILGKDMIADVKKELANSEGTLQKGFEVIQETTAAKATAADNAKTYAASDAFSEVKPHIDRMLDGVRDAAEEFPRLTTVVYEAATALGVLAAVGMAWGGSRMLRGGGGKLLGGTEKLFRGAGKTAVEVGGKAPLAKGAAEADKTALEIGGGAMLKGTALEAGGKAVADATAKGIARETMQAGAKAIGKTVPLVEFGMAAYEIAETESNPSLTRQQKDEANMATYGGLGGTLAGAAGGAAAGSVVPGIGTGIGAFLGGLFGWWAGRQAGEGAGKLIYSDPVSKAQTEERQPIELNAKLALEVDGLTLAEVMEKYQTEYNFRSN